MKIDGQCHCGNISYTAEIDENEVAVCHCHDCQSLSASVFRTILPVASENLAIIGSPKIYVKTADSGAKREQAFCPECGSAIYATSVGDDPKIYNLRLGTARQRSQLVPKHQKWFASSMKWLADLNSIPTRDKN